MNSQHAGDYPQSAGGGGALYARPGGAGALMPPRRYDYQALDDDDEGLRIGDYHANGKCRQDNGVSKHSSHHFSTAPNV